MLHAHLTHFALTQVSSPHSLGGTGDVKNEVALLACLVGAIEHIGEERRFDLVEVDG